MSNGAVGQLNMLRNDCKPFIYKDWGEIIEEILTNTWCRNRADRWTAVEVLEKLEDVLDDEDTMASIEKGLTTNAYRNNYLRDDHEMDLYFSYGNKIRPCFQTLK